MQKKITIPKTAIKATPKKRVSKTINKTECQLDYKIIYKTNKKIEDIVQNELISHFIIYGQPATKKNSQSIVRTKYGVRIIPSAQYTRYEKACQTALQLIWGNTPPINYGIRIDMQIALDSWRVGDHAGYIQSLGDILQKYSIVEDDIWIFWNNDNNTHWLIGKDQNNPRVEIKIYKQIHPNENRETYTSN